jgi:hypothetical protein
MTLTEELLTVNLNESHLDNGYVRRVVAGKGDQYLMDLEEDIASAKSRRDISRVIRDIEDQIDDCGYGEELRNDEAFAGALHGGALVGGLIGSTSRDKHGHSNADDVLGGALIGMAAGALLHHYSSKQESIIVQHYNKLKELYISARRKERTLK